MIRKLLLCACMMMAVTVARSQVYVEGRDMNADTSVQFIEIVHSTFPGDFYIEWVDKGFRNHETLTNAVGKKLNFSSGVDLLKYMKKNGWSMVRRDMVFQTRADAFYNRTLVFILFERTGR